MSEKVKSMPIELPSNISVRDLAVRLKANPIQVIKALMSNGVMASINQAVDFDTAAIVVAEYGFDAVPEVHDLPGAIDPGTIVGDIEFNQVEFLP